MDTGPCSWTRRAINCERGIDGLAGIQTGLRRGLNHLGVLALNLEPGSSTQP
jgi:hypothetical protein